MNAEGWYVDPYRAHEDRWYSDGNPTALVRDAGVESHEPPPSNVDPTEPLVRTDATGTAVNADDLRRADAADPVRPNDYTDAAFDGFGQTLPPG
jgi:hypothetical protein